LNRNQNLTRTAIDKLQELQTDEGGWSWIKGFYPSRSITQYVLYGLGRLDELIANEADTAIAVMSEKAVNYIDAQALRSFEQLKKNNKNWRSVTANSLPRFGVYVCSIDVQPIQAVARIKIDDRFLHLHID